ncbi:complex I assembly factor ACAD9, mitochondrial [Aricia agestis]|uniref:complex I assembly factor ACAD9, mitochondrial n=1 Tax=Aricia agestis TaxID=91739 RepID=UPI001C2015E6|nr:complex I assembly factor ACAD9, mitochondrial [Aricia agestis]
MNITRKICHLHYQNSRKNVYRKFRLSAANCEASSSQPQVHEKFDFEDLKVVERTERRKAQIPPFMKDVFVSIFNRELLAFPEILNKDESSDVDRRVSSLEKVFNDQTKTRDDRKEALKKIGMYSAPVALTKGGYAMNNTESLRYLDVISSDVQLGVELSNHWVGLNVIKLGLKPENYNQIVDELVTGDATVSVCVKEKVSERILQADFKTTAEVDMRGIWHITGEKICHIKSDFQVVLCLVEGIQYRAFLVHRGAKGVNFANNFITFDKTPATPLDEVSESDLSKAFGVSRLHVAALCRNSLLNATKSCIKYVRPRFLSGQALSSLTSIQAVLGDSMIMSYASESAEYFTAGLLDGYVDPDAEVEMAMCRNFIAKHAQELIVKILAIPGVEQQEECSRLSEELRNLALLGENDDHVNMFIVLSGLNHAGKMLAEEVKQIRNPLFHPGFILKKMVANRHQENDNPKLTLHLSEHLHPTLLRHAEGLEYAVLRMRYAVETVMARNGAEVEGAATELLRLAEAGSEILAMAASLARASRSYCIGVRNGEIEMKLASCFVDQAKERVRKLIKEIDDGEFLNLDRYRTSFGKKMLESKTELIEKPTVRVFW